MHSWYFTGLIPGIHINLVGVFLVSLSVSFFSQINPVYFVVFISAMSITHTFVDFIPSIFLGCPDTDTVLSVLPGHELLKKGQGYQAIVLTCYGSLAAIFILIAIILPSIFLVSRIYEVLIKVIPYLLIVVSLFLIFLENKRFSAVLVFLLTGFLGWSILNFPGINQPLLPLLTGLFGSSMLFISIRNKTEIPSQKISKPRISKLILNPLMGAFIAAPICSFLPGLGSGQAAIIGNTISKTDKRGFLILLGATNTLVMGFSFVSLYLIEKTRTGAALAISEIIGVLSGKILLLIIIVVLISGLASFFITIFIAEFISKRIKMVRYTSASIITLIILIILVFVISGTIGLVFLAVSTLTGVYCISLGVRRTNMMGCLLIPTILYYLIGG